MQENPWWKKLKNGWPEYLDEMGRMFFDDVDGSTSFVPGVSGTVHADIEDEELDELEAQTPVSIGTKRVGSTSTTCSSLGKKSKSLAVQSLDNNMKVISNHLDNRNQIMASYLDKRQHDR